MNFIFISPQFPYTYWNFCDRLKKAGVNVLAIGDENYDALDWRLRNSITEYYKVGNMENYSEMFKAVAFFSFKYGKIDWIESNNEYWLESDARLREDFNVTTGAHPKDLLKYKSKYEMKKYYKKAGVPFPRCIKVTSIKKAMEFIEEIGGYPVIAKPENGVGASHTYKIENESALSEFFRDKIDVPYVMEEFIDGDIVSYDTIVNEDGEPLFESMTVWPPSIADIVNNKLDLTYYVSDNVDEKLKKAGRAAVKAFDVKGRFVHLEFFKLKKEKKGLGKKGDIVALEVNMRPAGGYTPDMMNYAHSFDVYSIYADMVLTGGKNALSFKKGDDLFSAYASRRDGVSYKNSDDDVKAKYGSRIVMNERLPQLWWDAMGNYMYTVKLDTKKETEEFISFVTERA